MNYIKLPYFDWEPFKPFTVGFDSVMDRLLEINTDSPNYPPYNIRKIDELKSSIEMALAGFSKEDIDIKYSNNTLIIKSVKQQDPKNQKVENVDPLLYRGISSRAFTRSFALADDVVVNKAKLENGLLTVELEKIVPEEKKPKTIKIN